MKDNWTIGACIKELTDHGWIFTGRTRHPRGPLYHWENPTAANPTHIPKYGFTPKEMRDVCRKKFPDIYA